MSAENHSRKKRKIQISILIQLLLALFAFIILIALVSQYIQLNKTTPESRLRDALGVGLQKSSYTTIDSSLGFNVSFNKKQFTSVGYVIEPDLSFKTYDKEDVFTKRDYAIVNIYDARLKSKENVKQANFSSSEFNITTSTLSDFFDKRRSQYGNQLSEIELTEKHFSPKTNDEQTVSEIKNSNVNIEGTTYKKVVYKIVNTKLLTTTSTTEAYYVVKNHKPFAITLTHVDDKKQEFVNSLRELISNISYGSTSQSSKYGAQNSSSGGKVSNKVSGTSLNTPYDLEEGTALSVVAKNQPATVRVGTVYCAKITLKLSNGKPYSTFDKACNGGIGSGSIISNKGYVSTNGHVTTLKPNDVIIFALLEPLNDSNDIKPLQTFINYLSENGQTSAADELVQLLRNGDQEAVSKLSQAIDAIPSSQIEATDQKYDFAIQLGKSPMRINTKGSQMSFVYKKNEIVRAKLIDKNFNVYDDISTGSFSTSDVAVLKITDSVTGGYPVIKLGSISGLKKGDLVTAIGYPAFVDGGTETKQKYTYPTATQGKVLDIGYDSDDEKRKLVSMTTPIAQGNSGGPAFSTDGNMVGLNTYANGGGVDSFSINSTFRDVADLKQLINKNGITTDGTSSLSKEWSSAIDNFSQSKFQEAQATFDKVIKTYPSFYLAQSFNQVASREIQIQNKQNILKFTICFIIFITICVLVGLIIFIRRLVSHNKLTSTTIPPQQIESQPQAQSQTQPQVQFDQYPPRQTTPQSKSISPPQNFIPPNPSQQDENDPWRDM